MEHKPLISVITVSYNAVACIDKTILSVINQTYSNMEYIIIDGGSTDGTVDVIKKYGDKINYWISEADNGIYDAMNKGISKAKGDWILFMNADDCFASSKIISDIFSKNEITEDIGVIFGNTFLEHKKKLFYSQPFYERQGIRGMGFSHQSVFVRTKLAKVKPFDLNYRWCADYNMIWNLYYNSHVGFLKVDIAISIMQMEDGATVRNYREHLEEVCRICGYIGENRLFFIYKEIIKTKLRNFYNSILFY